MGNFPRHANWGALKVAITLWSAHCLNRVYHHKAGIIITRKIGNAVTRNRLRRRIHNILAKHIEEIDCSQGKRYIVTILRWRAPQATSEELEKDWLKQARRLGMLKPTI